MSAGTKIEWTDYTWPVVTGCQKRSPGCANCYAIGESWRLAHNPNLKVSEPYALAVKNGDARQRVPAGKETGDAVERVPTEKEMGRGRTRPYQRKTGRQRGRIWGLLRSIEREVTWRDLTPPLTPQQAKNNLAQLEYLGEFKVVRPGIPGRNGVPAVYRRVAVKGEIGDGVESVLTGP